MLNLRVYSIKCWQLSATSQRIWQSLQLYTMQFVQVKLNEKALRNCQWNFLHGTNLADTAVLGGLGAQIVKGRRRDRIW
ncbi:hypothetical protein I8748_22450 [Nostoc sp. CENA67]|uniref:Uncharacterized protein n=1 Tax=Amazonocrinis nigriterrae CENA67 TaxID=2794033 RepID=A0A8J7HZ17_9NOST|nr:hypothetical protein [Amazonocrinis nigriterrae CENA67]